MNKEKQRTQGAQRPSFEKFEKEIFDFLEIVDFFVPLQAQKR